MSVRVHVPPPQTPHWAASKSKARPMLQELSAWAAMTNSINKTV